MTSQRESDDVTDGKVDDPKDLSELPPIGLHKRRRGEPPATLSVKSPQTPSETEGSSPCTAGPYDYRMFPDDDPKVLCDNILQRLKDRNDLPSERGKEIASKTKDTLEALELLETLLKRLDQFTTLKEYNANLLKRLRDVNQLKRLHLARKKVNEENQRLRNEGRDLELINETLDTEFESEYGQVLYESMLSSGRSMKRTGSKWKGHARFGSTLLRKQRSRSAGGEDSDVAPGTPLRRRSEGLFSKEVEKSKVSKWTRVKAAFRWEKAQWPTSAMAGAAGAVVAGATMVGAVALAGTSPPGSASTSATLSTTITTSAPSTSLSASRMSPSASGTSPSSLPHPEPRDSASLTPGSVASLTPNSSCEELRMEHMCRKEATLLRYDENDNTFLHAPPQDDSSTSPSPNKLHKSRWGKMRDMLQPHRESVKKRGSKSSPDVVPTRRRSLSDGGDSDAPPALTLTIPSSEELESDPHPMLRKQRSLELGSRPPQHRPPRASKWTKVKRAFLTSASASVPSSPSRHSAFFTDAEGLSSGCEATGMREEIARDYAALQSRLRREFSDRRGKYNSSRPVATEEQLSADFRKKLAEWQLRKSAHQKQPPPVPARQDLSEDFLKKWDQWNSMKETNSVPAWEEEAKPDEVLVQTSTGLFKFQGISRSFTRKLHEWEKSRGIAPEASTSALLRAARARNKAPPAPLTRTQSDGSVAPSAAGSGRLHASSLSVNDADDFDSDYEREHSLDGADECDDGHIRGAVLVEVEAEEVCTAAPLMAVSPRHTPQKPIYTYGQAEARLLCETSSAVTGTAVLQPNSAESRSAKAKGVTGSKSKSSRDQAKDLEKSVRKNVVRQPSIEEDALFIRKTIEEVERGSSFHFKNEENITDSEKCERIRTLADIDKPSTSKTNVGSKGSLKGSKQSIVKERDSLEDLKEDKRKELDKSNGKKKSKSRARLEREQSKPSESDTEPDIDTVTVEIPRRRKKLRRASERPKTPPTARFHTDSEEEVFVLKLKPPERREHSPEVIVKTTRKIFSPVVRSGESVPRAVIPLDVEELADVRPSVDHSHRHIETRQKFDNENSKKEKETRSKSSGDLRDEEQHPRSRPPLPSSPSSQRKPQSKETAPSIRIMIQRYNKKINEEGNTSGPSSGASSPAWRSPAAERRRPPDMPVGVNIRNNPFLEREVQKSASACQLSRRDQTSVEKRLAPTPSQVLEGVLKSHSANALHPEENKTKSPKLLQRKIEASQETVKFTASTDTIVPDLTRNLPENQTQTQTVLRQMSEIIVPSLSSFVAENPGFFERSLSTVDAPSTLNTCTVARLSDRAAKIRAARERFLSSTVPFRREGTSSANDLRPGDRSSQISCESDVTESQSSQEPQLARSVSTGMVNVDRDAWQRVAEGGRREGRSRFSLARLAAKLPGKLKKKDEGAVSRLCRQSLLVQLRNKQ
ncbi:pneumococcal serine-rich repeat protein isoform X2 [Plodia interpunctella]|uniref:pneumococcal serine-rich repeat protein isoform X2 n=1 Tax=Plodia interpunctella TaxID=58824 RepID=UPI002368C428|nr:pneumococcal serine-rich repeat protein isoform X2 [Plodia interpunctella]